MRIFFQALRSVLFRSCIALIILVVLGLVIGYLMSHPALAFPLIALVVFGFAVKIRMDELKDKELEKKYYARASSDAEEQEYWAKQLRDRR